MEITLTQIFSFLVLAGSIIGVYGRLIIKINSCEERNTAVNNRMTAAEKVANDKIESLEKQIETIQKTYVHERELNNIFASLEEIKELLKEERKIWSEHILKHK